jgi:hypothetical protein
MLKKHVHVMKIDTEGAELEVLRGFRRRLGAAPPLFIFFEVHDKHLRRFAASRDDLFELLWSHNYRIYRLARGRWHELSSQGSFARFPNSADFLAVYSDKRRPESEYPR